MAGGKYKLLSFNDRKMLEEMYLNEERPSDIAKKLGVHTATVYKELRRGMTGEVDKNMRPAYSAKLAQSVLCRNLKKRGRIAETADLGR